MHFFIYLRVLGDFLFSERVLGILSGGGGGESPQEIAGINTAKE